MIRSELDYLGLKYGTDKNSTGHDYLRRYEPFLAPMQDSARKVLEIGIAGGASLLVWAEYFSLATIHGVDHNPKAVNDCPKHIRILPYSGEATDGVFWLQFARIAGKDFDLIIDDGSHHSSAVITTFGYVWPLLRSGGLYIIEDLHCSYDPAYNRTPSSETSIEFLETLVDVMNCHGLLATGNPTKGPLLYSFLHFGKSFVIIGKP